jgi:hypothetical protein
MTPEVVAAKLAEMTAAFHGKPAGNAATRATETLANLTKEHNLAVANGGQTPQPTFDQLLSEQRAIAEQRDAVMLDEHLRAVGLSPQTEVGKEVSEYISGKRSISPELRADLDAKIESWKRDPDFQRRLFSGDAEANRLLNIAVAMKLAPIKGSAT